VLVTARGHMSAQRFMGVPPDVGLEQAVLTSSFGAAANATGNVVMYPDIHNVFEELLFRGVEMDLLIFEILVRRQSLRVPTPLCRILDVRALTRACADVGLL
jgi:hypothetical protein